MASSLKEVHESLCKIISTWDKDDWTKHEGYLSRIRASTRRPRDRKKKARTARSQSSTSQDVESSIDLLALPVSGQDTPERVETTLETLGSEKDIAEHCKIIKAPRNVETVAKSIFLSSIRPIGFYEDIWPGTEFYQSSGTVACRLLEADVTITNEDDKNAARRRINALLFALHFNTRLKNLGSSPNREKTIKDALMKESHKTSNQIKYLLNRGRWFMEWVRKFGLGAILALGKSVASDSNMGDDLRQLIQVCEVMSGFRKRAQMLFEPAKKAVEKAMELSGGPSGSQIERIPAVQYVGFPGVAEIPSNDRVRSCTPDDATQGPTIHDLHITKKVPGIRRPSAYLSGGVSVPTRREDHISDIPAAQSNAAMPSTSPSSWVPLDSGRSPLDTLVEAACVERTTRDDGGLSSSPYMAVVENSVAGTTYPLELNADLGVGPTPGPPHFPEMYTWRTDNPSAFSNGYERGDMSMDTYSTSLLGGIEGVSHWRDFLLHDFSVDP